MANFGSALANFGLMSQGSAAADKAVQDREFEAQRIEAAKRANEAATQQSELTGQRIRTGSMAENEMRRQADTAEAYRASTKGLGDASEAAQLEGRRTTALGLGDLGTATQARQALSTGAEQAKLWLANQAQIGADPKAVSEQMRKLGYMDVGEDLQWGMIPVTAKPGDPMIPPGGQPGDHLIMWTDKQGGKHVQSATAIIRAGSKADVKVVPAEGSIAITGPGRQPQVVQAPAKTPAKFKPETLKVYNADGQAVGEKLIDPNTKEVISSTVGAGSAGGAADRDVKKALPELKEVTSEVLKIPGMATKSDPSNPLDTHMILTPQGQALMPRVEALVLANRALPAHTAILVAMNGTPGMDSKGSPVVQYGGKVYPLSSAGTRVTPPPKGVDKAAVLNKELKENQTNLVAAMKAGDAKKITALNKNIEQLQAELAKVTKPIRPANSPIPTSEVVGKKNGGKISKYQQSGLGA